MSFLQFKSCFIHEVLRLTSQQELLFFLMELTQDVLCRLVILNFWLILMGFLATDSQLLYHCFTDQYTNFPFKKNFITLHQIQLLMKKAYGNKLNCRQWQLYDKEEDVGLLTFYNQEISRKFWKKKKVQYDTEPNCRESLKRYQTELEKDYCHRLGVGKNFSCQQKNEKKKHYSEQLIRSQHLEDSKIITGEDRFKMTQVSLRFDKYDFTDILNKKKMKSINNDVQKFTTIRQKKNEIVLKERLRQVFLGKKDENNLKTIIVESNKSYKGKRNKRISQMKTYTKLNIPFLQHKIEAQFLTKKGNLPRQSQLRVKRQQKKEYLKYYKGNKDKIRIRQLNHEIINQKNYLTLPSENNLSIKTLQASSDQGLNPELHDYSKVKGIIKKHFGKNHHQMLLGVNFRKNH